MVSIVSIDGVYNFFISNSYSIINHVFSKRLENKLLNFVSVTRKALRSSIGGKGAE